MVPSIPNGKLSENTIRYQHQQLKSLMDTIANRFRSEQKPTRDLVSLLNALEVHLQMHFEFEESDGYFSGLAQKTPRVSTTVERLLGEHDKMLKEMNLLVTMVRETFEKADNTFDLAKRFSLFHSQLVQHEHEETKLIQDVYNVDIGTSD